MPIQSVMIPKKYFQLHEAIDWMYANGFAPKKVHKTVNFYRFRLAPPSSNKSYYTVTLHDGIKLVMQD